MEVRELEGRIKDLQVKIKWTECIHGTALQVRAMRAQIREYETQIRAIKAEAIKEEQRAEQEINLGMARLKQMIKEVVNYEKV